MSAFIVEDKTINVVVTKLAYDRDGDWLRRKFKEKGYDLNATEGRMKLGKSMFSVNVRSINQRYGEGEASFFRPLDYSFTIDGNHTKISCIKALSCWLYQSCEGECKDLAFYKMMEDVRNGWCYDVVRSLPEWNKSTMW